MVESFDPKMLAQKKRFFSISVSIAVEASFEINHLILPSFFSFSLKATIIIGLIICPARPRNRNLFIQQETFIAHTHIVDRVDVVLVSY